MPARKTSQLDRTGLFVKIAAVVGGIGALAGAAAVVIPKLRPPTGAIAARPPRVSDVPSAEDPVTLIIDDDE